MKVIFLDHDSVICLSNNWGGRFKKWGEWGKRKLSMDVRDIPVEYRFDNFDRGAVKVLNEILEITGVEIVVSSDWRNFATLGEMGEYYIGQGINKKPIGMTKMLGECEVSDDFPWDLTYDLEQSRSIEILQYLGDNPGVTHWVAVDDLNMGKWVKSGVYGKIERDWGLVNFVWTPLDNEGIKQSGVKDKIIKFLV